MIPERLQRTRARGVNTLDLNEFDSDQDLIDAVRAKTAGRGPDAVIDAVGMEAHGSPGAKVAQRLTGLIPNALAAKLMKRAGVDRLAALHLAIELVRRGGTVSIIGVYGGMTDPMPMMKMFDLPLADAPSAYETFQKKQDDAIKIVFSMSDSTAGGCARR